MQRKNLCVIGGGGFVGHHLISLLAAQGHSILVPTRRIARIKDLSVLPTVELVECDIHDPATLERLTRGQDAVINLVGILHGSHKAFVREHVKLPHKIMDACRANGVPRYLHMSALGADPASRSFYQHSKGEGERLVLEPSRNHELNVTVFRPSVIFGPGDSFLSMFGRLLQWSPLLPLAGAASRFQPIYVGDVARAFAASLDDAATHGQAYNLCGPRVYTLEQLVRLTAATLGLERRILPLGDTASWWLARMMELKPGPKIMTRDNYYAMRTDNVCPDGFPARFGAPTALETVIGYLREDEPRRAYDGFRSLAGR